MYSYNQLIKVFNDFADNHRQINNFGFGDDWEACLKENIDRYKYPLLWVVPTSSSLDETYVEYNFDVIFADRVDSGEIIENDVLSDQHQVAIDLFAYLQNPDFLPYFTFEKNGNWQPFTEGFIDNLTGVILSIRIKVHNLNDRCAIPLSSGVVVSPLCEPVSIYNSSGTVLTTTVASGGQYNVPKATVNRDGSFFGTVESGDTINVPSAGGQPPSLAVELSTSTPVLGASVTITATASDVTPTSYDFFLPNKEEGYDKVTQASNVYVWTVDCVGAKTVYVGANDGTDSAYSFGGNAVTVTQDPDGNAFIAAHNAATGSSMGATQQTAIHNLFFGLKGYGLGAYLYRDIYTTLDSGGSKFYPYCPIDDSTANASAYQIELFTPASAGTFNNFLAGDFTANGVIGGSGKYFQTQVNPADFNQNSLAFDVYQRDTSATNGMYEIGAFQSGNFTLCSTQTNGRTYSTINMSANSAFYTNSAKTGLFTFQRFFSSAVNVYEDATLSYVADFTSIAPNNLEIYAHALNNNGTASNFSTRQLAWVGIRPQLCVSELQQLEYVIDRYQANVITGGRDV